MDLRKLISGIVFLCLFAIPVLFAEEISLPRDAKPTKSENVKLGPTNMSFLTYSTSLSKAQLTNFYRKELTKSGWSEMKKAELHFRKDNKIASIVVMPRKTRDNLTQFTIMQGELPTEETMRLSQKDKADKVSFMPVYPKASQLYFWDTPTGAIAGYKTGDDIKDVVFFYKSGMLNYGWSIYGESPITEQPVNCPECEKNKQKNGIGLNIPLTQAKTSSARLAFRRGQGEICILNIYGYDYSGMIPANAEAQNTAKASAFGMPPVDNQTQIMVSYNANKKINT